MVPLGGFPSPPNLFLGKGTALSGGSGSGDPTSQGACGEAQRLGLGEAAQGGQGWLSAPRGQVAPCNSIRVLDSDAELAIAYAELC